MQKLCEVKGCENTVPTHFHSGQFRYCRSCWEHKKHGLCVKGCGSKEWNKSDFCYRHYQIAHNPPSTE